MIRLLRAPFALILCVCLASQVPVQGSPLDLIPNDAALALVVRSIDGLKEKGEQFFKAHDVDASKAPRPSQLFDQLIGYLDLKEGLDRTGSAALILPNPARMGLNLPAGDGDWIPVLFGLVVVVPITDADTVGKNFGFQKGQLVPGKTLMGGFRFVQVRGKYLYLGLGEKAVDVCAESKSVMMELSAAQKKTLANADILLHFGSQACGKLYRQSLDTLKQLLTLPTGDRTDNEAADQFVAALREARFLVGGLILGETSSIDLVASFQPGAEGAEALKFLRALRAGPGASDLIGLPRMDPLVAFAAKGDGERNVHLARALLKVLLDKWLGIKVEITEEDRKKFLKAFDVIYQHLKGSRSIVYRTDPTQELRVGQVATMVILDVDDAEAHRTNWKNLVDVANSAAPMILKQDRKSSPRFSFKPNAEMIDGLWVDWIVVEVSELPKEVEVGYRKSMGPDWNKLRMVVVGKQIVGLFGSDVPTLTRTLTNLKKKEAGVAGHPAVTSALARLSPERKLEWHISLEGYAAFLAGEKPTPTVELTSLALTVEDDRVQLEIKAAKGELSQIVKRLGLGK